MRYFLLGLSSPAIIAIWLIWFSLWLIHLLSFYLHRVLEYNTQNYFDFLRNVPFIYKSPFSDAWKDLKQII